jgi:hypothetical protein
MHNYDMLIHESVKVLKVLYVLVIVLILKTTLDILFMVAIPQVNYSVKTTQDRKGAVVREETRQSTMPILANFFKSQ